MDRSTRFLSNLNSHELDNATDRISAFLKSHGLTDQNVQEQIWITKELLQACAHYSGAEASQESPTIQIDVSSDKVTVEVSNQINGIERGQLEELDKLIQSIRGYQDPFEALLKLKTSSSCDTTGEALARLSYQGNTAVDFFVSENNTMKMSAVRTIGC